MRSKTVRVEMLEAYDGSLWPTAEACEAYERGERILPPRREDLAQRWSKNQDEPFDLASFMAQAG